MLTIFGGKTRFCDGVTRRSFLKAGAFAFPAAAGFTLADVLRAEAATGRKQHKALINIFLAGGPPHQDMWDLKMDAPSDIRGEFKPIPTNLPGLQICEVFPQLAKRADKYSIIRSVVGCAGDHDAYQCMTGWRRNALQSIGGYPSIGSVAAKLHGPIDPAVPPAVGLAAPTRERRWSDSGSPGFLGAPYAPFKPFMAGDKPSESTQKLVGKYEGGSGLKLQGITPEQLQNRRRLLEMLGEAREDLDHAEDVQALDASFRSAFDLLTSTRMADALDLSKEDPKTRARYGDGKPYKYQYDGSPTCNDHLLMARRLVEAGARCVTLSYGRWDSHGKNFDLVRDHGSKLDQCLSALIDDLYDRGLDKDVSVIVWGEFGRTPKINNDAGRDHWPQVSSALLFGGGMRSGQVIGATDSTGGEAAERPVHMQQIFSTLYHNMGINAETQLLEDRTGRPQFMLEHAEPVAELIG